MEEANETAVLPRKRTVEMAAISMIGDGLLGTLQPERHPRLWKSDVAPAAVARFCDGGPWSRRACAAVRLAAALSFAASQRR